MTNNEYEYIIHSIEDLNSRIDALENVIKYALNINKRCHDDDYAYDDCWQKMRDILKERE